MPKKFITILLFLIFSTATSFALAPEKRLPNEAQEQRAMNLFLTVRCLVCEGQVIESSSTEFSFEMRQLIRKKILEGKKDGEIKQELVQQFGDDILTEPNTKHGGFLLWLLPAIFIIAGGIAIKKLYQ